MKKNLFFILIICLLLVIPVYAEGSNATLPKKNYATREYSVLTSDGHNIYAYLTYPKTKLKYYPTIVMLHSIGYNSRYMVSLQEKFNDKGFAVLRVDLRGHGKSVYDKNFRQKSWTAYKNSTFEKYPNDIYEVIQYIQKQTKKVDFNNWAVIGGDIGANTAVLLAKRMPVKPKALVLMAPSMSFKGLYIPVALTEIGKTPILAIASKTDNYYMAEQEKISRFAQGTFDVCNTDNGSSGVLILKQHPEIQSSILAWVLEYFN